MIGLNSALYTGKGMRAGRACDLLAMGVSVETIKKRQMEIKLSVHIFKMLR